MAEGQILAVCWKCATFFTAHFQHIFKWLAGPILCVFMTAPHPLYISVTEINHNSKDKILEVSCKIFTNDFETVLEKWPARKSTSLHRKISRHPIS